ncbi:hypothetical protein DN752_23035 [Echinicola strongylocentroti]|uniref:RNA polymerase sigma-70 factor n=1 Tax=Echinicola strongylocentroti TaxID=1795355 RepID=A0A2Z4IQG0_9BACT|nr:RNA polymerase sigma-70 factor [Echinicola strongylocentroti]AWW32786.1 hypothetical protein DN752_23035 [Echinicola strongylocentroti]
MNTVHLKDILRKMVDNNDEKAFSVFFDHYHTRMINMSMLFVQNFDLAEEVVSEVLLKLLQKKERLLKIENFEGYLFKMVKNYSLNKLKFHKKESKHLRVDDIQDFLIPDTSDPEKDLINCHLGDFLDEVIQKLPPKRRMVFKLIKEENMSYSETAALLEISVKTVDVHLSLAIKELRKRLKVFYDEHQEKIPMSRQRFLSIFL